MMADSSRRGGVRLIVAILLLLFFFNLCAVSTTVVQPQLTDCREVVTLGEDDSLPKLSEGFFGTAAYDRAILLATNTKTGDSSEPGFKYISDPYKLPAGAKACIPTREKADELRAIENSYGAAVAQMVRPQPSDTSDSLVAIDTKSPIRVVTWKRSNQLSDWRKADGTWKTKAVSDIWVTVVPKLKLFCQEFVRTHHANTAQLTLRLEQRLGLPPDSNNDVFVEMIIKDPSKYDHLFRPCINPSVAASTCQLGPFPDPLPKGISEKHRTWIYRQYYDSYAIARPNQYPWTALGYTFDWANDESGRYQFVKVGESEFVVPQGAPIEMIQPPVPTAQYCSP
jgi:hypothetical protein